MELDDLGDQMLFVGKNRSMSLAAASYPGCKGNCIYFTDEDDRHKCNARDIRDGDKLCMDVGNYDMGMYDMESGDVFPFEERRTSVLRGSKPVVGREYSGAALLDLMSVLRRLSDLGIIYLSLGIDLFLVGILICKCVIFMYERYLILLLYVHQV